jgi:hypothetical protein
MHTEKFNGDLNRRFQMSRPVIDDRYVWVTLFKSLGEGLPLQSYPLINSYDFTILEDNKTVEISDSWVIDPNDFVEIISFISPEVPAELIGYRIFNDMLGGTTFTRLSAENSTYLTRDLAVDDDVIYVADTSVLSPPIEEENIPGIMFINGERITYWTKNIYSPVAWTANTSYANSTAISHNGINYLTAGNVYANSFNYVNTANISVLAGLNILGQIRRGTQGTAISPMHYKNKVIIDASKSQIIPTTGNLISNINIWYNHGISTITDGAGLNGSTTTAALFLKGATAGNVLIGTVSDELTTEDAINTLTTEDSIRIIEEDQ